MTTSNNPGRFIRLPEVMKMTGKPRTSIYEDMRIGSFPKAILIGKRAVAWTEEDILSWMCARASKPTHPQ